MKNKTQKYYWKVVDITDDPTTFTSCIVNEGKYCLTYKVGKQTKSAMTENGVFVFDTRESARIFKKVFVDCNTDGETNYKVFKCIVHGEEITNPIYYTIWQLSRLNVKCHDAYSKFPKGTKSFPAITLVKQSK